MNLKGKIKVPVDDGLVKSSLHRHFSGMMREKGKVSFLVKYQIVNLLKTSIGLGDKVTIFNAVA
jgi:hypothetical protein